MHLLFERSFPTYKAVDVRLRPGESKEYTFQEKIPPDAPPSYSGGFVKVGYENYLGAYNCV